MYLSLFSHSFSLFLWSAATEKSTILQVLFFLLIIIRSGLLAEIRWSVCMSKSHRSLCVLFSRTCAGSCIYHLLVWSKLNFLHISLWITLPTQPCLVLYFFCANLLHSLIMWLMVSSLSPHSLHLQFRCVLSLLALIWLVHFIIIVIIIQFSALFSVSYNFSSSVGWSWRICWVHLCKGVRSPPNECPVMTPKHQMVRLQSGALGNVKYLFIVITPTLPLIRCGRTR